jgi:hypothetical protein
VFNEVQAVVLTLNFPAIAEAGHAEQSFNYLSQIGRKYDILFMESAHRIWRIVKILKEMIPRGAEPPPQGSS